MLWWESKTRKNLLPGVKVLVQPDHNLNRENRWEFLHRFAALTEKITAGGNFTPGMRKCKVKPKASTEEITIV